MQYNRDNFLSWRQYMLKEMVNLILYLFKDLEPFWAYLLVILLLLLGIVRAFYWRKPEWEAKKTKDKDGNEITIYSRIRK